MLEAAVKYPFRGEDSTERLVVGGVLPFLAAAISLVGAVLSIILIGYLLMPFAIVPRIFLWGYLVAAIGALLAGESDPPAFDDWKQFGIDGVKALLITLAYSLPLIVGGVLLVVIAAIVGTFVTGVGETTGSASAMAAASSGVDTAFGILFFLGILVVVGYTIALYYVLPAAVVNFVREDDLAAAFHLRTLADIVWDADYLVAWLLAVVVLGVGNMVAFPLYFVLVGFVLRFVVMVVAVYLVTKGVMESMNWEPDHPDEDLESAVRRVEGTHSGS